MHIVTVAPQVPDPGSGGGGNWGSSLIRHFVAAGHRVTHVAVLGKHGPAVPNPDLVEAYRAIGVPIVPVTYPAAMPPVRSVLAKLRSLLSPRVGDFWPIEVAAARQVADTVKRLQPDCIVPFAFDAVVYTDGIDIPRVGVQAEGPHINTLVNLTYDPQVAPGPTLGYWRYRLRMLAAATVQERIYAGLTGRLTVAAFQGPHYVEWARRRGLTNAVFVTTPTPDPAGQRWRDLRAAAPANDKTRILMIGHLHSTSNRSGLPIFFDEILPTLEREWGIDKFEIHIVGRNERMPRRFDRFRDHPALRFRGPVIPATEEFVRADVLLVPIPAKTGSRVRIINGWTYGCCVVAHTANQLGIPELEHDANVLLSPTGAGIARLVIQAAGDAALRQRLGEAGRREYEKSYAEAVGGDAYLRLIEAAVQGHQPASEATRARFVTEPRE